MDLFRRATRTGAGSRIRRIVQAGIVATASLASLVMFSGPAHAATGCSGSIIDHTNIYAINGPYVGDYVGRVNLYWDGTYNCVIFTKSGGPYYGVTTPMQVWIWNDGTGQDEDHGNFAYYVGPAKVNGVGKCIKWEAYFTNSSGTTIAHDDSGWYHCS